MASPLNPIHSLLQILHVPLMHSLPHILRQQRPRNLHSMHNSLVLQPAQRRRHQVILPRQPLRQEMNRQYPRERRHGTQPKGQIGRIQQVVAQLSRHVSHFQRLNVAVPVGPEIVERSRPHVRRHAKRGSIHGSLSVQLFGLFLREAAEKGILDDDEGDEERGGGPFVQLGVVGVVPIALDVLVVAVDDGEDGILFLGGAVDGGVEETSRVLESLRDAGGEAGMEITALCETRVCELAEDGELSAKEVYVVYEEFSEQHGFLDGFMDQGREGLALPDCSGGRACLSCEWHDCTFSRKGRNMLDKRWEMAEKTRDNAGYLIVVLKCDMHVL